MHTVKRMNRRDNVPDIYNFRIGEYDLTVTVTHENIRLSFNKNSNKGVSEFLMFTIPLVGEQNSFSEFIKYCDEQDKSEFPFLGGK